MKTTTLFKDDVLSELSATRNVARFVSFGPGEAPEVRHVELGEDFRVDAQVSIEGLVDALLARTTDHSVNVRSFDPASPKSNEFLYGLKDSTTVAREVRRLAATGFFTIVNETIDVNDGGVSGVAYGAVTEFAPDDTPRAVEKPGTAALPTKLALDLLQTVYGFTPDIDFEDDLRIEFSVHPIRRGTRDAHTIVWEVERGVPFVEPPLIEWPNRFSRFVGDKVYGLLVAHHVGLRVPETTVISRRVAPFTFGQATGTAEAWIRTAPPVPVPGRFTTQRGWRDPFDLLGQEDDDGTQIASVLRQEGVDASFSGAAASTSDGKVLIEGVAGFGEGFMKGEAAAEGLPVDVTASVTETYRQAQAALGPIRMEWAYDGERVWVLQMHRGQLPGSGKTIFPGSAAHEYRFDVSDGLEALRDLVTEVSGADARVVLVGDVGITSHFGDVLRAARIPSRVEANACD